MTHARCVRRSTLYGPGAACGPDCAVVYNVNAARGARAALRGRPEPPNTAEVTEADATAEAGWWDGVAMVRGW